MVMVSKVRLREQISRDRVEVVDSESQKIGRVNEVVEICSLEKDL
jgi:hypothetical protein